MNTWTWGLRSIKCEIENARREVMEIYRSLCCQYEAPHWILDRRMLTQTTFKTYHDHISLISESFSDSPLMVEFIITEKEEDPDVLVVMEYLNGAAKIDSIKTDDPFQYTLPINENPI